jgi:hypothetical protein
MEQVPFAGKDSADALDLELGVRRLHWG